MRAIIGKTGDEEELKTNFEHYSRAMDIVTSALINVSKIPAESAKDLAARIEKALKKNLAGYGFDIQKLD